MSTIPEKDETTPITIDSNNKDNLENSSAGEKEENSTPQLTLTSSAHRKQFSISTNFLNNISPPNSSPLINSTANETGSPTITPPQSPTIVPSSPFVDQPASPNFQHVPSPTANLNANNNNGKFFFFFEKEKLIHA
jgi:hypothetical protein